MNAINVIKPYKWNGIWVFDDPNVGLIREAFVAGADNMIDEATEKLGIPTPEKGFCMLFSETPFPGHQIKLDWVSGDSSGNTYHWEVENMTGWLCPALFKYFNSAPKNIYIKIQPAT